MSVSCGVKLLCVLVDLFGVVVVVVSWLVLDVVARVACAVSAVVWGGLRSRLGLSYLFI